MLRLFHAPAHSAPLAEVLRDLARRRTPFRAADDAELARVAGSRAHQGLVAVLHLPVSRTLSPDGVQAWAAAPGLALLLDGVENPHNIGALARTAAFLGVRDLAVAGPGAAALHSGAVYRTAEGAMESLTAWRLEAAAPCIRAFVAAGGTAVALDVAGTADLGLVSGWARQRPCLLVAGGEERGMAPTALAACSLRVRIAGSTAVQSLNVSVATALALFALRGPDRPSGLSGPGRT